MFTQSLQSEMSDRLLRPLSAAFAVLLIACATAEAQVFNSGSNGSDGALNLTTPGEVIFDPAKFTPPLDPDGDNVFHFTTITIGKDVTVKLKNVPLRGRAVIWLASGDVKVEGTIDLSAQAGQATNDQVLANRVPAESGPGGYAGGVGSTPTSAAQAGNGPGRGGPINGGCMPFGWVGKHGSGAGHAGGGSGWVPGAAYGNVLLVPLRGGSGGGGGSNGFGGGGGGGGGALRIVSSTTITVNGAIAANGGNGGGGSSNGCILGDGGGGSGGAIHLISLTVNGNGSLSAKGGAAIYPGSGGRIRVDALRQQFIGSANPPASLGSPYNVPLSADVPSIRVVSVDGKAVSSTPTGSFTIPDVTINQTVPIPVMIEAINVPLGVIVQVYIISEAGPDQVVNSTLLAGTKQKSTATANVKLPPGFSRGYVRATWDPIFLVFFVIEQR